MVPVCVSFHSPLPNFGTKEGRLGRGYDAGRCGLQKDKLGPEKMIGKSDDREWSGVGATWALLNEENSSNNT
ncbi:unnamed protein product [Prunus armeniaca]|uniref:Uncharacterized protein n=1 Tax=Prunus armeniaca TaxID=36596 RepID=A0A6J5Y9Z7_PRUAR|nr:unnamed protein product [Prunus armeniaca]